MIAAIDRFLMAPTGAASMRSSFAQARRTEMAVQHAVGNADKGSRRQTAEYRRRCSRSSQEWIEMDLSQSGASIDDTAEMNHSGDAYETLTKIMAAFQARLSVITKLAFMSPARKWLSMSVLFGATDCFSLSRALMRPEKK
jgi:hypothetical protein